MSKFKILCVSIVAIIIMTACSPAPTTPETIEVPVTVEVTKIVEIEIESTVEVQVEVTRIVTEEIIQTVEIPVEVTRMVEIVVTATPEPTIAASTAGQTNGFSNTQLLNSMNTLRSNLLELGGMLDGGTVYCDDWIEKHDRIAGMSTYNTAYANDISKWAYEQYRGAIDAFLFSSKDMTENARTCQAGFIPFQQWGLARQGINQATDILQPAIKELGGE